MLQNLRGDTNGVHRGDEAVVGGGVLWSILFVERTSTTVRRNGISSHPPPDSRVPEVDDRPGDYRGAVRIIGTRDHHDRLTQTIPQEAVASRRVSVAPPPIRAYLALVLRTGFGNSLGDHQLVAQGVERRIRNSVLDHACLLEGRLGIEIVSYTSLGRTRTTIQMEGRCRPRGGYPEDDARCGDPSR
jgi:hypothetical protein